MKEAHAAARDRLRRRLLNPEQKGGKSVVGAVPVWLGAEKGELPCCSAAREAQPCLAIDPCLPRLTSSHYILAQRENKLPLSSQHHRNTYLGTACVGQKTDTLVSPGESGIRSPRFGLPQPGLHHRVPPAV